MAYSPYSGPQETTYLFIDGGCLRATLSKISERYAENAALTLDFDRFTQGYTKVFYYDALPARNDNETDEDYQIRIAEPLGLIEELRSLDRFHVYEGDVRRARSRRERPEQKKVDVMITVDMLTHSFKRNMNRATLLASDMDFVPLINALVQEGMFVSLYYPPGETHTDLIAAADGKIPLRVDSLYDSLTAASKELFAVPKPVTEPARGDFAPIEAEWQLANGNRLRIYRGHASFTAELKPQDAEMAIYLTHEREEVLLMFIKDIWQTSPPVPA